MLKFVTGLLAIIFAVLMTAWPASTKIIYPWCAQLGGRNGGSTNCGFLNREQCMADIGGIGGPCYENPTYPGTGNKPKQIPDSPRRR